ncbi:major facilitator superfamily domain-containing protein [Syncephalastrum racemosum]|uniref:Major facilitator superfamily domain-containing protein n=1 Tax=Syncephalastrum racemosum TaxID=13706 RepID=A0A1X2H2F1_SYNRA|nr:major facilitator superfamily domain-containing protein [Syncephalastrum racemosum]
MPDLSIPPDQEKRVVRALDLRLLVILCLFYFTDFLDRVSIGSAKVEGLPEDLNATVQTGVAVSAFYITYITLEIPSNLLLKRFNASLWLSGCLFSWGIITLCTAFVTNFAGILAVRLLLGVAQSGYIPGVIYLISKHYKVEETGVRIACINATAFAAGILSGPIAYGSMLLDGAHGLHGWQYLFLIEGAFTAAVGLISYWWLFDDIQRVKWLTDDQKHWQKIRMQRDVGDSKSVALSDIRIALFDWKTYAMAFMYLTNAVVLTSLLVFAPTVIDGFGFSRLTSLILPAAPNASGFVMALLGGYLVDRYGCRELIIMTGFFLTALGCTLLLVLVDAWSQYGCLFLCLAGVGFQSPAIFGWPGQIFCHLTQRAVSIGAILTLGGCGSVIASFLFPATDEPRYCKSRRLS